MGRKKKFFNDLTRKEYWKQYRKHWKRSRTKYMTKAPENGKTLDTVDMMERNAERFNYGLELNR